MMEGLEPRELLSAAADGVIVSDPASDIVIAADAPQAPLATPTGVNITKTFSTSLIVGWTDQSASESGHRVERSTDDATGPAAERTMFRNSLVAEKIKCAMRLTSAPPG